MVFSSYSFLFLFLPIVLVVYFGMAKYVSRTTQHIFLVFASLVFYAYNDIVYGITTGIPYVLLIMSSVAINYGCAKAVAAIKEDKSLIRKSIFVLAVLFNVGLLGYYKYTRFILENINIVFDAHFTLKYIILPIGISFFTFQQIAYQISIWKRKETIPRFLDYSLFITFFPQLVAGPIVFSQDVMSQYQDDKNRFFNIDNFAQGIFIFCIGLFKKAVLADSIALVADTGFTTELHYLSFGGAWATSLAYTMQIFFDFSGYSDMAIGLGQMMNIKLPVNFYSPYRSQSITEFWQRWHITLGRSLAVLIYFPLGGNRKGYVRTCVNLFIVFLVSGIWHGAAWTFVIWGMAHGVVRVLEKIFEKQLPKIPSFIRIFFTFMFVNAAWVLFRAKTVNDALSVLQKMFIPKDISFDRLSMLATDGVLTYPDLIQSLYIILFIGILLLISIGAPKNSIDYYNSFKPRVKYAMIAAAFFCISIIHISKAGAFIYFNF